MPSEKFDKNWYQLSVDEVQQHWETPDEGLSSTEAESRLDEYGANTIQSQQEISAWKVLLDQFTSPLIYVLLAALVVTLAIQSWSDAIVIGLVLVVNGTIGFLQEYRAETAVQSLMEMVSPKAKVRRDGQSQEVHGEELVPGDLVLVSEGDMVPADLRLIQSGSLQVNESALTGESVPVSKSTEAISEENLPPADQENMAFMGTAVTSGHAEGTVVGTGQHTELGQIAKDVQEAGEITTPLQRRMDRLAKAIAVAILIVAAIAFGVGLWMGKGVEEMFLTAVALAVAAMPAGLPVVMTVALAIGVRRMARRHAVIRHLPAVETLGSTTTILSDKTGTLTQNRMTVQEITAETKRYQVTGESLSREGDLIVDEESVTAEEGSALYWTLVAGFLNNEAHLKERERRREADHQKEERPQEDQQEEGSPTDEGDFEPQGDPMEVALLVAAVKAGFSRQELDQRYPQIDEVPFQTERRFSATLHDVPDEEEGPLVLVKGAPEAIFEMCDQELTGEGQHHDLARDKLREQNEELASAGLRVLAMALGRGQQARESIKSDNPGGLIYVGMQGLMDPPRPEAVEAVDHCHEAGIRVVMVTGDHAQTAAAIAQKVHLDRPVAETSGDQLVDQQQESKRLPDVITGQRFAELSDEQLDEELPRIHVYARFKPDQKLRLVERLKDQQQIVAVTGDGVNDAPALKAGHLGAAMGETGTDVAKEASDMVITDDNFASVYSAVEEGRTAFRNIRMATFFLLSTGAADVLIILTALGVKNWPLPLLPAQILWCNVVTNGIADVALGFEPGEKALFRRPPRPASEGVLDATLIERLVAVGIWLAAGTLGMFYWVYSVRGESIDLARVTALTTLVLFQKVHVFNCRSEDVSIFKKNLLANKVLLLGVLASLVVHVAALYIPWTQNVLNFQPLPWDIWVVIVPVAFTAIIVNELHKWLRLRKDTYPQTDEKSQPWYFRWLPARQQPSRSTTAGLVDRVEDIQQTVRKNRELLEELSESERRESKEHENARAPDRE